MVLFLAVLQSTFKQLDNTTLSDMVNNCLKLDKTLSLETNRCSVHMRINNENQQVSFEFQFCINKIDGIRATLATHGKFCQEKLQFRNFILHLEKLTRMRINMAVEDNKGVERSVVRTPNDFGANKIRRICITGGPCAGKTTSINRLKAFLEKRGLRVYIVQETATMLFMTGCTRQEITGNDKKARDKRINLETELLRLQISLEDAYCKIAHEHMRTSGEMCVILCDRGTMDVSGFLTQQEWAKVTKNVGATSVNLRDERYDAVLHLVTAALGAEPFYTTDDHPTRVESIEEARVADEKIKEAWVGHPKLTLIPNIINNKTLDFETKLRRVMTRVCEIVGVQPLTKRTNKFILHKIPTFPDDIKVVEFEIEKIFLKQHDRNKMHCIQRRSPAEDSNQQTCGLTTTTKQPDGTRVKQKRIIKPKEYEDFARNRDQAREIVKQHRYYCNDKNLFFKVNQYINLGEEVITLSVQTLADSNDKKSDKKRSRAAEEHDGGSGSDDCADHEMCVEGECVENKIECVQNRMEDKCVDEGCHGSVEDNALCQYKVCRDSAELYHSKEADESEDKEYHDCGADGDSLQVPRNPSDSAIGESNTETDTQPLPPSPPPPETTTEAPAPAAASRRMTVGASKRLSRRGKRPREPQTTNTLPAYLSCQIKEKWTSKHTCSFLLSKKGTLTSSKQGSEPTLEKNRITKH
eukprot:m.121788 g.121788  ORF g.121788 m.121788 type:complete len:695 (-) comp14407_c0_seq1:217-2301(-)